MHRLAPEPSASSVAVASVGLGAGALALGASACCVPILAPLLVSVLGVSGSIWAASLSPYSIWIVSASGLVVGWAGWLIYRPRLDAGAACRSRPALVAHSGYWVAVAIWVLALALNVYSRWRP